MDLSSSSLTITPARRMIPRAVSMENAWSIIPRPVWTEILRRDVLMREIHAANKKRPAMAAIAKREGDLSDQTLKRLYYGNDKAHGWKDVGTAALIDHRKCGGCGVLGCNTARARGLPQAVIDLYKGYCMNDKQGLTESWETVIRRLCNGDVLADGINWETLHMDLFPGLDLPARCPWSLNHPPPGWSLSTFMVHKPSKALLAALKKGGAAAWLETPDVRMDLTSLRFLQAVVFDDHKLDFEVLVWDAQGKVQIVELWGLFAMDMATGAVIAFGLRPAIKREDGSHEGLTMRDMQHLIAFILGTYGYPLDYRMTLIVENAAAAVSKHMEHLLLTRTNGQVVVRRTGVHMGEFVVRGFAERWGGPRGKAMLESFFHPLDIALGMVKGQTGSNWTLKPGDHEGRLSVARKLAAVITAHPGLADKLSTPLHWAGEAWPIVNAAIKALNERGDHKMERHESITEFRWSESDPTPKPMRITGELSAPLAREVQQFLALPAEARSVMLNNYGTTRRESPTEKVRRIYNPARFTCLAADTYLDMMMDSAGADYKGGDVIDVKWKRGKEETTFRFSGPCHAIELGESVRIRFNADMPSAGAWVHNDREQFLCYLEYERDPRMMVDEDLELLQRQMGAKHKAFKQTLTEARRLSAKLPETQRALKDRENDLKTLSTLNIAMAAHVADACPESAELAQVVMKTRPSKAKPLTDAEELAARRQRLQDAQA